MNIIIRIVAALSIFIASFAMAQTPTPTEADLAKAQASKFYKQGVALFKAKKFVEARAKFERAYKLDPAPTLLYNWARSCEELGDAPCAVEQYDVYLARFPDQADAGEVKRRVRLMRNILAAQQKGKKPPAAVPEELQLPDKLAMPGPNPPNNVRIDSPPVVVDQPKDEPVNLWPWAIGTAGAALLCGGGAFILHQQVKEREQAHAEANTGAGKQTAADAAERNALLRDIVIVTGGVAAAAALTLTGIELFSGDTTAGVAPTPGGAAVMLGGTF